VVQQAPRDAGRPGDVRRRDVGRRALGEQPPGGRQDLLATLRVLEPGAGCWRGANSGRDDSIAPMSRLAPLVLAALALAACGDSGLNVGKAKELITTAVVDQIGAEVESVECPAEVEPQAGATFGCTVTASDRTSGRVLVTQKDDEGNVRISAPFVHTAELEERIGADIERQVGGAVTLECPQIVEAEKDETFECEAAGEGERTTVLVTQRDDEGNVRYEITG
jgi:hypothetical protein